MHRPSIDSVEISPTEPPSFSFTPRLESDWSTKRERIEKTPNYRCSAPKLVKSAPQIRSIICSAKKDPSPRLVTINGPSKTPLESPHYKNEKKPQTFFEQVFVIHAVIGNGSFGEVFSVQSREDSQFYAIKVSIATLRQHSISKYREAESHMSIRPHKNLVRFYRAWEEADRLYIQTELCDQSLQKYCSVKFAIPEDEIWNIFIDLLQAVHHLHSNDMIHDDIKPDNIFLTQEMICKLGDFGLAVNLKNPIHMKTVEEGDAKYLAPEVLNGSPTKASDIFSLGVTILEAATDLDLPSSGEEWHQLRNALIPEKFLKNMSKNLRYLIESMLERNPNNRPTAEELLEAPAIKEKLFGRDLYIHEVECRNVASTLLSSFLIWCMAFLSVIYDQIARCHVSIHSRRIGPNRPRPQHTPLHTPINSARIYAQSITGSAIRRQAELDNVPSREDHRPSINPLNLDDGSDDDVEIVRKQKPSTSSSGTESNSSVSPKPVRKEAKAVRRLTLDKMKPEWRDPCFIRDPLNLTEEERTARYLRIRIKEMTNDENDRKNQIDERPPPNSCPSRFRSRLRGGNVPLLDFNKLDMKDKKDTKDKK
uniref:Membrane-associated tyrosine- and threonine-specific cdc2-inhibitory kinase wee-1.3 n=1 Tax=Caenorhabditis tropicalis TaxID=1561998 RepID=A0A1I7UFY7_9PELO